MPKPKLYEYLMPYCPCLRISEAVSLFQACFNTIIRWINSIIIELQGYLSDFLSNLFHSLPFTSLQILILSLQNCCDFATDLISGLENF